MVIGTRKTGMAKPKIGARKTGRTGRKERKRIGRTKITGTSWTIILQLLTNTALSDVFHRENLLQKRTGENLRSLMKE